MAKPKTSETVGTVELQEDDLENTLGGTQLAAASHPSLANKKKSKRGKLDFAWKIEEGES